MLENIELTLLTQSQIWGSRKEKQLDVFKKCGTEPLITEFSVLTGAEFDMKPSYSFISSSFYGLIWTESLIEDGKVSCIYFNGNKSSEYKATRNLVIRPVIKCETLFNNLYDEEIEEIYLGKYPQFVPSYNTQVKLNELFNSNRLKITNSTYTIDDTAIDEFRYHFKAKTYPTYEYNKEEYIRIRANFFNKNTFELNGNNYNYGDYVWVKILPLKWLIDKKEKLLICKYGILSGVMFDNYKNNCDKSEIYRYMNEYMLKDILQSEDLEKIMNTRNQKKLMKVFR